MANIGPKSEGYILDAKNKLNPEANEPATDYITPQDIVDAFTNLSLAWRDDDEANLGVTGATGPTGPSGGPVGPQGPQGLQGSTGPQGLQGLTGPTGSQGTQGVQGEIGPTGPQGFQGVQGAPSDIPGPQGPVGPVGPVGPSGPSGPVGPTGQGINVLSQVPNYSSLPGNLNQANRGDACIDSSTGLLYVWDGLSWPEEGKGIEVKGSTGSRGPQGIQGIQGIQGETGPIGPTGPANVAWVSKVSLLAGVPHTLNHNQDFSNPLVFAWDDSTGKSTDLLFEKIDENNISVESSTTGDFNITLSVANNSNTVNAPQGLQGRQGDTGPTGPIGPQGIQGEIGVTGPQGIQGIQGIQGPTGDQGVQGIQGIDGVGVSVLPPVADDAERLALSPVDGNIVLQLDTGDVLAYTNNSWVDAGHLVGPQGIQGIQGIQGVQGEIGPTGPQGIQGVQGITGDTGPTGPQGIQGITGATGSANVAWVSKVSLLAGVPHTLNHNQDFSNPLVFAWDDATGKSTDLLFEKIDKNNISVESSVNGDFNITISVANSSNTVNAPQGLQGRQGDTGPTGPIGPQGIQGEIGVTGPQGIQGIQGITGATGSANVAWVSKVSLLAGVPHTLNHNQDFSNPLVFAWDDATGKSTDLLFEKIDKNNISVESSVNGDFNITISVANSSNTVNAPQGLQGRQGDTGPTGPQGIQGVVGPTGSQGIQGETGIKGDQGIQGVVGPTGPQGIQGVQGVDGVGISVLPPVADAAERLALSPVDGNLVLQLDTGDMFAYSNNSWFSAGNLVGPQGVQGDQGIQGVQGEIGPTGPDGKGGFAADVVLQANTPLTVSHNLGSTNIILSFYENNLPVEVPFRILTLNDVELESTVNANIKIVGVAI